VVFCNHQNASSRSWSNDVDLFNFEQSKHYDPYYNTRHAWRHFHVYPRPLATVDGVSESDSIYIQLTCRVNAGHFTGFSWLRSHVYWTWCRFDLALALAYTGSMLTDDTSAFVKLYNSAVKNRTVLDLVNCVHKIPLITILIFDSLSEQRLLLPIFNLIKSRCTKLIIVAIVEKLIQLFVMCFSNESCSCHFHLPFQNLWRLCSTSGGWYTTDPDLASKPPFTQSPQM
jgi:hypothetical protein